ncbi:MAG: D-alanyl-D-alanine carboxypeptidase/D-alanyl-D-alanine-endopeptidase [Bacteroidia bacterium]|nr:D-alanyl-D-alanine carboxypeptidase/D-alanyl-D-alanine-endopeptidase [Bacteroidia bacterium]
MNKITIFLSSVISLLVIPAISLCQNPVDIIKEFNEVTLSLKELLKDDNLKNSSTGFYAIDVNTGEILVEFNPDLSMVPASVQKIITTAAALEILGKNFRFCTTLEYDGEIDENGTLNGNIFIRGGGDPALGSDRFKKHYFEPSFWDRWCDSIKRLGIKKINGSVIGDAGIFDEEVTPPTWAWGDIGNYYGASPSGLSVYENMYSIFLNSGPKAGDTTEIAGIEPEIPGLCFENYVKSADVKDDEAFIYGAVYTNVCRIRGSIPKGQKRFEIKGSIPDPAFFAAFELD